ncbi:C39 family peptidase [Enterococcus sp. LJL90]
MTYFLKKYVNKKRAGLTLGLLISLTALLFFSEADFAAQPDEFIGPKKIEINANRNFVTEETIIEDAPVIEEQPLKSAVRLDVPLLNQMAEPRLYNGCEVTSLAMILNYHGFAVTKNQLAEELPTVSVQDANGNYGNPHEAFVGDMTANSGPGYFVYHEPIYQLASQFIDDSYEAIDLSGSDFTEIQRQLSIGNPVWVITTTIFAETGDNFTWQTATGEVSVSMSEHSVVLTGYDENEIYLNDPYGNQDYATDLEAFIASWEQMGRQAVVITEVSEV